MKITSSTVSTQILSISKEANTNYLAKVVVLKGLRKHSNADKLQCVDIDFQTVITGMDAKDGDIYVYFPVECAINKDFLSFTNSFRDKELNHNKEKAGFFEENCRVRAVKLRGEKSMGYIVPFVEFNNFTNINIAWNDYIGQEFDTIGDILICKKYFVPIRVSGQNNKQGKKPKISRLIDGQFHFHIDTENLRKNIFNIKPDDEISITYKIHGSSFIVSNVLVKKKLNLLNKLLSLLKLDINKKEYDMLYASRKVVKNGVENKECNHYYGYDIWEEIKEEIKHLIPKGFTIYGEMAGYLKTGQCIQRDFDYGCEHGKKRLYIYRITITNEDGIVTELTSKQIKEFCDKNGLEYVPLFYCGKAKDLYPNISIEQHWHENFIKQLELDYTEKDCFICKNKVPCEGIVLKKESIFNFEAYKLKSHSFLMKESEELDKGETNIEDNQ